jgi:hypothetical protein
VLGIRLFTTALVVFIAGLALAQAAAMLPSALSEAIQNRNADLGGSTAVLKTVVDSTGDAAAAQRDCERREKANLSALVSKPVSSEIWLLLAECRVLIGEPPAKVVAAWRLSLLTGANQHDDMLRRAVFTLSYWDRLAAEPRNAAGMDLVGEAFDRRETAAISTALSRHSESVRRGILLALQSQRVETKTLVAIGF